MFLKNLRCGWKAQGFDRLWGPAQAHRGLLESQPHIPGRLMWLVTGVSVDLLAEAQVKGPMMDATDVYLQEKAGESWLFALNLRFLKYLQERYENFAHNLDEGERQQHKLIHMLRSSLRKHHAQLGQMDELWRAAFLAGWIRLPKSNHSCHN